MSRKAKIILRVPDIKIPSFVIEGEVYIDDKLLEQLPLFNKDEDSAGVDVAYRYVNGIKMATDKQKWSLVHKYNYAPVDAENMTLAQAQEIIYQRSLEKKDQKPVIIQPISFTSRPMPWETPKRKRGRPRKIANSL